MKNLFKILISLVLLSGMLNINTIEAAPVAAPSKTTAAASNVKPNVTAIKVSPLDIVNSPEKYLNKEVTFTGEFVAFTSLGLDYKPAYKDPLKYIGILIKRPDVQDHTIPLSEMKMFLTREIAEKHVDMEAGDKIEITGKVFSTALGDPWIDITTFKSLAPKKEKAEK